MLVMLHSWSEEETEASYLKVNKSVKNSTIIFLFRNTEEFRGNNGRLSVVPLGWEREGGGFSVLLFLVAMPAPFIQTLAPRGTEVTGAVRAAG